MGDGLIPTILDADGNDVLASKLARDDIRVYINIGGLDFTNEPIPLSALTPKYDNKELHSGYMLPSNHKFTLRFEARRLPNASLGISKYPLLVAVTLKGYEVSNINH